MRLAFRLLPFVLLAALSPSPTAAHTPDGARFVATFGEVCIPQRSNYKATLALAERLGWKKYVAGQDATVDRFLDNARQRLEEEKAAGDVDIKEEMEVFTREIAGRRHLLAVTLVLSEILDLTGCYLYDFAATAPIDAAHVTKLLKRPIAYTTHGGDKDYAVDPKLLINTVWGPPPSLPRTFDTYLTFIPKGSPAEAQTGFTGLVLKFSTGLPKPRDKR